MPTSATFQKTIVVRLLNLSARMPASGENKKNGEMKQAVTTASTSFWSTPSHVREAHQHVAGVKNRHEVDRLVVERRQELGEHQSDVRSRGQGLGEFPSACVPCFSGPRAAVRGGTPCKGIPAIAGWHAL